MTNGSDDDDYLSDKFLLNTAEPQKPKTYSEKRKEALFKSRLKSDQNRIKSRRQLEIESREDGLSKSLFERAEDDKASGSENKALSMMMKMGFKPGQALGLPAHVDEDSTDRPSSSSTSPPPDPTRGISPPQEGSTTQSEKQLVNPLPLNEWSGTLDVPCALFINALCPPLRFFFLCFHASLIYISPLQGRRASALENVRLRPLSSSALPRQPESRKRRKRSLSGTGRAASLSIDAQRRGWRPPSKPVRV
jgi:hypothetical protein